MCTFFMYAIILYMWSQFKMLPTWVRHDLYFGLIMVMILGKGRSILSKYLLATQLV
jgi:hypothetical protein